MAGYAWNPGQTTTTTTNNTNNNSNSATHLNGPKRPYAPELISCRICDSVFTSTQALIDHIESHMSEEDLAAKRQQHGHGLSLMTITTADPIANNPFQLSLHTPTSPLTLTEGGYNSNNYPSLHHQGRNSSNLKQFRPTGSVNFSTFRKGKTTANIFVPSPPMTGAQIFQAGLLRPLRHQVHQPLSRVVTIAEKGGIDSTKPFLQQLEEKPVFDWKSTLMKASSSRSDPVGMVDLTLKL